MNSKKSWILTVILTVVGGLGCGGIRRVDIIRPQPIANTDPRQLDAFQNIYVRIHKPERNTLEAAISALTKALSESTDNKLSPYGTDLKKFGKFLSERVSQSGGHIAAVREAEGSPAKDPFLESFSPTGTLQINIHSIVFARGEISPDNPDKKEKAQWEYRAAATADYELLDASLNSLRKNTLTAEAAIGQTGNTKPTDAAMIELQNKALEKLGAQIVRQAFPVDFAHHYRPLFRERDQADSVEAYEAALRGKWGRAKSIWLKRTDSPQKSWKDHMGLAVAAEQQKDYVAARQQYQLARDLAAQSSEAKKINWAEIEEALTELMKRPAPPVYKDEWFAKRLAVLPFSDEVVILDAPDVVRLNVFVALKEAGYNVLSLEEVDEKLKTHGYSEGGQLANVPKEKIAKWLEADHLLSGNIEEFNEVNVGVYRKRIVSGELSLWDAAGKAEIWKSNKSVTNQTLAVNKGQIVDNLLGGLTNAWLERVSKSALGPEVKEFTQESLESLPFR